MHAWGSDKYRTEGQVERRSKMSKRSKEEISAIVSGAGLLTAVWTDLIQAVHERGGTNEDIYRLNTPEGRLAIGKMADIIVGAKNVFSKVFRVTVDYGLTIAQAIQEVNCDWVNSDINDQNFSVLKMGEERSTFVYVRFDRVATTVEVLEYMKQNNLVPADIKQLLAFGKQNPDEQRKYPIVELGSGWLSSAGDRHVAYLSVDDGKRKLNLLPWGTPGGQWVECYRFLAIFK